MNNPELGYYWVRTENGWAIMEWWNDHWWGVGRDGPIPDDDVLEIHEPRLISPVEFDFMLQRLL